MTEAAVERTFRKLFALKPFTEEVFEKAENLLEELRAESPLRLRLSQELEELRELTEASA